MKKIFLLILGFVMFKVGYSQGYPIQQFIGADSAVVTSKGGMQGRFINVVFPDTTTANSQRIRQYAGAMIYAAGKLWVRNTTATGWTELAYGPITPVNIYNSNGSLTSNRTLDGDGYSLTFDQIGGEFGVGADSINFAPASGKFRISSLNQGIGTKALRYNPVTKLITYSDTTSSVNIYNSDGTLTGNRELDGDGNNLTFTAVKKFEFSGDSLYYLLDPAGNLRLKLGNQQFTMQGDTASLSRRISYTGNLGSSFTKHSLVDRNYVDSSITASPSGTVTSVATNNATGITGGPITTTGTLAIDTNLISTRAWRQKGIDSVASLANSKIGGSGTTNYVSKFTASGTIGNSQIFDNGTSVGIITTSPTNLLTLVGSLTGRGIDFVTQANFASVMGRINYETTNDLFSIINTSSWGNSALIFGTSNTERMRISQGGNVGIGTTSINSSLEIYKASGTNYIYLTNGTSGTNNGVVLRFNNIDYMGMIGTFTTGELKVGGFNAGGYFMTFYSNNSERMRLTPSGRLLLGTTTESTYILDANGTVRVQGTELRLDNGTTGTLNIYSNTPSIQFFSADPTGYRFYRSGTGMIWNSSGSISTQIAGNDAYTLNASSGHIWRTALSGGAALARLTTGGNLIVGGTTDAGYRADIQGTSRFTGTALFTGNIGGNAWNYDSGNGRWVFGSATNQSSRFFTLINIWSTTAATLAVRNIASQTANSLQIENSSSTVLSGFDVNGGLFVGSTSLNASAIIEATSTTKGFLPPRMTNAQMVAIATPAAGLVVYDTTNNKLNVYDGTNWVTLH